MKNPIISILLPSYKAENLLEKVFIPSLRNCSVSVEVILRDNGGNGNIRRFENENVKVIGDGDNVGLNVGLNDCAKSAKGQFYFLCHNDMYLLPGWDTALLSRTKNLPPTSYLLCSRSIEPIKGHTEYHIIKDYGKEWHEFNEKKLIEDFRGYMDGTATTGARMPFFMNRALWDKMRGVDPSYFSYCTDDDLVQTAYDVGVRRFWMVNGSLVYHLQGKSNAQQKVDKDSNKPYEYFINKWKKKYPDAQHPGVWHPRLIPWYIKV